MYNQDFIAYLRLSLEAVYNSYNKIKSELEKEDEERRHLFRLVGIKSENVDFNFLIPEDQSVWNGYLKMTNEKFKGFYATYKEMLTYCMELRDYITELKEVHKNFQNIKIASIKSILESPGNELAQEKNSSKKVNRLTLNKNEKEVLEDKIGDYITSSLDAGTNTVKTAIQLLAENSEKELGYKLSEGQIRGRWEDYLQHNPEENRRRTYYKK